MSQRNQIGKQRVPDTKLGDCLCVSVCVCYSFVNTNDMGWGKKIGVKYNLCKARENNPPRSSRNRHVSIEKEKIN